MNTLTVYLLKDVGRAADALDPRKRLTRHEVRSGGKLIGELHVAQSSDESPAWLRYFRDTIRPLPALTNRTSSGVLLIERASVSYAITFGQGRYFLRPGTWTRSFGLRVALNSIGPAMISSLERKTFDALGRLTRTQTIREGTAGQLGIDVEHDLLRAITGRPLDPRLGSRVSGADALVVCAPPRVEELPSQLARVSARYRDKRYRDAFGWVDRIAELKDPRVTASLDDALIQRLARDGGGGVEIAPPDMVDWERVRGFAFRASDAPSSELRVTDFIASLGGRAPRLASLKSRRVYALDDAGAIVDAWSVDRCLSWELTTRDETFVRSDGHWFRIERGLVKEVSAAVDALERDTPALVPYADASEGDYNARVAAMQRGTLLVDKKLLSHGGGPSRIEFCDLFTNKRQMIHVKRYCGSQTLSHLFAQGAVGAHLLLTDRDFRRKLDAMLPRSHRVGAEPPDARKYEVIFAIVDASGRRLVDVMPFFSRLVLRNTAKQLTSLGYRVTTTRIPASYTLAQDTQRSEVLLANTASAA